eukprot:jgi/Bigna1/71185/fgenesh1_pg.14_\
MASFAVCVCVCVQCVCCSLLVPTVPTSSHRQNALNSCLATTISSLVHPPTPCHRNPPPHSCALFLVPIVNCSPPQHLHTHGENSITVVACVTMLEDLFSFARRSAKLIVHFFKDDSILAKRLPHIYGPNSVLTYLYKLYGASFIGFLLCGRFDILIVNVGGFVVNAVGVGSMLGVYGGLTKLASIPHFVGLGFPALVVWRNFQLMSRIESPLAWISCLASLAFYIPVLVGDIGELYQVFGQGKYFVLMPDGVVHPLKTWVKPDVSIKLDMAAMFMTAIPAADDK